MKVSDRIDADIRAAMLAREKEKLESLRAIKAAFLLAKTEKGGSDVLSDETEIKILRKLISQREEAASIYKQQNRQDLYQNEVNEAGYISAYLPAMIGEDEIVVVLKKIIAETGASSQADFGKVMGQAVRILSGKADNKLVSSKLKELLG